MRGRARGGAAAIGVDGELLAAVGASLAEAAGLSLARGLEAPLRDALAAAAAEVGEAPAALARRVIAGSAEALAALLEHAVVTETAFWRHPEALRAVARRAAASPGPVAIWSAGCATGEEAYSLAMALLEAGRGAERGDRIVATDVSVRALAAAARASYGRHALRKLPAALAARWLEPAGPERRVRPEARALVTLARQDLVHDGAPAGAPFDAILCRNVLIYFEPPVAGAVLRALAAALRPGGALVLGPVELPLATALPLGWLEEDGATLLVRPA